MNSKFIETIGALRKNKLLLVLLLSGLLILMLPTKGENETASNDVTSLPEFSVQSQEKRLASVLEKIDGAGKVSVLLSVDGSIERTLAQNGEEALVLSGKGGEKIVDIRYTKPKYLGAVIVAQGADDPQVKMNITSAVSGFTGLGSNKIIVVRMVK